MENGRMVIRKAAEDDVTQIAEIVVEDWKNAYRGIIGDDYLDSISVEEQYKKELRRYREITVAAAGGEILGFAWNKEAKSEDADCEIVALYVRYAKRKTGVGRALFQNAINTFRAAGKKRMIIWCLKENHEARKFYEKMGGTAHKTDAHRWGNEEYAIISYIYRLDG